MPLIDNITWEPRRADLDAPDHVQSASPLAGVNVSLVWAQLSLPALGVGDAARALFGSNLLDLRQLADPYAWMMDTRDLAVPSTDLSPAPAQGKHTTINQLDYRGLRLGDGPSTLSGAGCFLSTLTMASNRLTGGARDLVAANAAVAAAGGFQGSNLVIDKAAASLGLTVQSRQVATPEAMAGAEQALDDGKQLFAGVDYKRGKNSGISEADHFLLVVAREGDHLRAVDPAGGREILFARQPDGSYRSGKYRIAEVGVLAASRDVPKLPPRPLAV